MRQIDIPAVYMRGGTSNAIVFHEKHLPRNRALWEPLFQAAMGSPDSTGRQLDGMGGGVSSLSKVCVVGPPTHSDADVDYTFGQVSVKEGAVDYRLNGGNMSAAIGPFAVDEGLVKASGSEALVRIYNTNTRKLIHSSFALDDGRAAVDGDFTMPGVAGTGARIRLDFLDPGGAVTGKLLPQDRVIHNFQVPGIGMLEASILDVVNGCVFINAADVGLTGTEMPEQLDTAHELIAKLEMVRTTAALAMGLVKTAAEFKNKTTLIPMIGLVSPAQDCRTIDGAAIEASSADVTVRMFSMGGWPHRAMPITSAFCLAVASQIDGSVVHRWTRPMANRVGDLRIAMPSGILVVGARVRNLHGSWYVERVTAYRTARRMFQGAVLVRASRVPHRMG